MTLISINPFTNRVIKEFPEYSDKKIEEILISSSSAFKEWRNTDFSLRKSLMLKVADNLVTNIDKYAESITLEMGKPIKEARVEIEKCAWVCRYYAEHAEHFLKNEKIDTDAVKSIVYYEPLGTILGIMPWNFPFWQVFRFAVPALMAGNTILLKHASNVQMCASHIEGIFMESGFPEGVFQNIVTGSRRMEKIIKHDSVMAVSLTGSESAGQSVATIAGSKIKKTLLELGGSNAFVVLADADLKNAVEVGIKARMQNGGQSCIAAKRFILHKDIGEQFIKLFLEEIEKLKIGDPFNEDTYIGPLASIRHAETINKQVKTSVKMGADILTGGKRKKAFYVPTLLINVKPGMPVFDEEVFGPVAPVTIAGSDNEAIKLANNTRFGLGVSLFTNDLKKAEDMINKFPDGAVFINSMVKSDPRLPFGGTKQSGYGRELGMHGIMEFVNIKTVYWG